MKKLLLFFFAALLSLLAHAKVEIADIWYNLDSSTRQAEVAYQGDNYNKFNDKYSGDIIIPSTVTYNGVTYSVTSIGYQAFIYCYSLNTITIPASVTTIGNGAFRSSALTTITCNATTLPTIGDGAFAGLSDVTMYVPAGNIEDYQGAAGWPASNIKARQYTLTVSDAGYATLYLDYAITIPKNVEVYYASSVEGNQLRMTRVKGVLPASTGVVIKEGGSYTFTEAKEGPAAIEGNLFKGTADKRSITAEQRCKYYVLAKRNNKVGMYKAKITNGKFVNNANKAYLPLYVDGLDIYDEETDTEADDGQLSNGLRFDFGGSTGIQNSEFTIQHSELIYDLQGRKVTDIEGLKGIYIVGGKKRVLK